MDPRIERALLALDDEQAEWAMALRPEEFWSWYGRECEDV
jgi:hypothetical protein